MKKLIQALTFSYNQNMGWKDRTIRAGIGLVQPILSLAELIDGKIEFFLEIFTVLLLLTSLTGKCFFYFLTGKCTNGTPSNEKAESEKLVGQESEIENG